MRLLAFIFLAFAVSSAFAQLPLNTGFEAPTYAVGNLTGQDNWTDFDGNGAAKVQSAVVKSGAQAVEIDSSMIYSEYAWFWKPATYDSAGNPLKTVAVSWDMMLGASAAGNSLGWGVDLCDEWGMRIGFVGVYGSNLHVIVSDNVNGGEKDTGFVVARSEWNHFDAYLNYQTRKFTALLNGQTLVTDMTFDSYASDVFGDADLMVAGPGLDSCYFDNLHVRAIPEPSVIGVLLPAVGLLFLRRRRS